MESIPTKSQLTSLLDFENCTELFQKFLSTISKDAYSSPVTRYSFAQESANSPSHLLQRCLMQLAGCDSVGQASQWLTVRHKSKLLSTRHCCSVWFQELKNFWATKDCTAKGPDCLLPSSPHFPSWSIPVIYNDAQLNKPCTARSHHQRRSSNQMSSSIPFCFSSPGLRWHHTRQFLPNVGWLVCHWAIWAAICKYLVAGRNAKRCVALFANTTFSMPPSKQIYAVYWPNWPTDNKNSQRLVVSRWHNSQKLMAVGIRN